MAGPQHHPDNHKLISSITGEIPAQELLKRFQTLNSLSQASFDELCEVPGIGESKARAIRSAFLLAQRLAEERRAEAPLLDTPEKVADLLREQNRNFTVETFQVVLLNTRRRLICVEATSQGTLDAVHIHPREVFSRAIIRRAAAIILVHNHPSGDPMPSESDIKVTRELVRAGELLKIEVLDHVILGQMTIGRPRDYVSLRELGYLYKA